MPLSTEYDIGKSASYCMRIRVTCRIGSFACDLVIVLMTADAPYGQDM